jgi:hypothetical protein
VSRRKAKARLRIAKAGLFLKSPPPRSHERLSRNL